MKLASRQGTGRQGGQDRPGNFSSNKLAERSSVEGLVQIRQTPPFGDKDSLSQKGGVHPNLTNAATEWDLSAISLDKKLTYTAVKPALFLRVKTELVKAYMARAPRNIADRLRITVRSVPWSDWFFGSYDQLLSLCHSPRGQWSDTVMFTAIL